MRAMYILVKHKHVFFIILVKYENIHITFGIKLNYTPPDQIFKLSTVYRVHTGKLSKIQGLFKDF